MRTSIRQRAGQASGRERYCGKCEFRTVGACAHLEACNAAFIRGYIKGYRDKEPEMPSLAKAAYGTGKHLSVQVDRVNCTVSWYLVEGREVLNNGEMDIELYMDNTWLPYEETHRPNSHIPDALQDKLHKLFHRVGMRKEE